MKKRTMDRIDTKKDLIKLLLEIAKDPSPLENETTRDFMVALASWLEDSDGYYANLGKTVDTNAASWQLFADSLQAAKIYE